LRLSDRKDSERRMDLEIDRIELESASMKRPALVSPASKVINSQARSSRKAKLPLCVYNQTRECFLGLRVVAADTSFARLKGLIGRLTLRSDEGLWVVPSSGIHTLGVLFPVDLVYLDEQHQVTDIFEYFPRFRIAPLRMRAASVLELPQHTIYSSQTHKGDQLLICTAEEMERHLREDSKRCVEGEQMGQVVILRADD
jgi:uncharacterized membrane protein (UPF0127 family)